MKKLLLFVVILALPFFAFAQVPRLGSIKFLGIPVDGTKDAMETALIKKGFKKNYKEDCLEGRFNGQDVKASILTDNGKVWRVAIQYYTTNSESALRIAYNRLYDQFADNPKYFASESNEPLPENDDISYELTVHDKRYDSAFHPAILKNLSDEDMRPYAEALLKEEYSAEDYEKLTDYQKEMAYNICLSKVRINVKLEEYQYSAWFTISKVSYSLYAIILFYDNEYNSGDNGQDL